MGRADPLLVAASMFLKAAIAPPTPLPGKYSSINVGLARGRDASASYLQIVTNSQPRRCNAYKSNYSKQETLVRDRFVITVRKNNAERALPLSAKPQHFENNQKHEYEELTDLDANGWN